MELLDQMEKRIEELCSRFIDLQALNASLEQKNVEAISALQLENTSLKEALLLEQQRNALARERIDVILKRIKEQAETV